MITVAIVGGAWLALAIPVAIVIGKATAVADREAARERHPAGRHLTIVRDQQ